MAGALERLRNRPETPEHLSLMLAKTKGHIRVHQKESVLMPRTRPADQHSSCVRDVFSKCQKWGHTPAVEKVGDLGESSRRNNLTLWFWTTGLTDLSACADVRSDAGAVVVAPSQHVIDALASLGLHRVEGVFYHRPARSKRRLPPEAGYRAPIEM